MDTSNYPATKRVKFATSYNEINYFHLNQQALSMRCIAFLLLLVFPLSGYGQFHPQALQAGSHAIHKDSSIIQFWGDACVIHRGWMDLADTSLGKVTHGADSMALMQADGFVVSLGDGGEAIYYFNNPISNGSGPDFAIFENGFLDPSDSFMSYMELAEVAVSNDGIHYHTFPTRFEGDTNNQIAGTGQYSNCATVNNLAGKYMLNYGTPFDLDAFLPLSSLNLNAIHYVRVRDIVGTLDPKFCTRDSSGHKINDPYPTPFPTGGFDLDAIGVIHASYPLNVSEINSSDPIRFYPNPCTSRIHVALESDDLELKLFTLQQQLIFSVAGSNTLDISKIPSGTYILWIRQGSSIYSERLIKW